MKEGRCTVTGSEWWEGYEKARKKEAEKAAKEAEKAAKAGKDGGKSGAISKLELKKIKKKVADMRKKGEEANTDEEVRKAGYTVDVE